MNVGRKCQIFFGIGVKIFTFVVKRKQNDSMRAFFFTYNFFYFYFSNRVEREVVCI